MTADTKKLLIKLLKEEIKARKSMIACLLPHEPMKGIEEDKLKAAQKALKELK